MRTKGKITLWNDEKGYGFITPSAGAKQVFFHIKSFTNRKQRPAIDQLVTFSLSRDKKGRPCAVAVTVAGDKQRTGIRRNDSVLSIAAAVVFLVVVCVLAIGGAIPILLAPIYIVVSLITIVIYAWDKSSAQRGAWRTQENTLHLLALVGGWPGALIAQQRLRHKSKKEDFRFVFWLTVVVNCSLLLWMFTASGAALFESLVAVVVGSIEG